MTNSATTRIHEHLARYFHPGLDESVREAIKQHVLQQAGTDPLAAQAACSAVLDAASPLMRRLQEAETELDRLEEERREEERPIALFHGLVAGSDGRMRAEVSIRAQHACLPWFDDLGADRIPVGHRVELNRDRNRIVSVLGPFRGGVIGEVREVDNGRLLVDHRSAEVMLQRAGELEGVALATSDRVRFDPDSGLAFEKVGDAPRRAPKVEPLERSRIAGYETQVARVERAVRLALDPDAAALRFAYGLSARRQIVLAGPPGTGKSRIMMYAATLALRRLGLPVERMGEVVVVVEDLLSPWVGEPNQRLRSCMERVDRAAAEHGLGVLLIDDADRFFANRAHSTGTLHRVHDNLTMDFCAWVDGLAARPDGARLVLLSSNHLENLDLALWRSGRAEVVEVGIPDRRTREEILAVHLAGRLVHREWGPPEVAPARLAGAVSDFLAGPRLAALVAVQLADGRTRHLGAADLVVGADLASWTERAAEQALFADLAAAAPPQEIAVRSSRMSGANPDIRNSKIESRESRGLPRPPKGITLEVFQRIILRSLAEKAALLGEGVRRYVADLRSAAIRSVSSTFEEGGTT